MYFISTIQRSIAMHQRVMDQSINHTYQSAKETFGIVWNGTKQVERRNNYIEKKSLPISKRELLRTLVHHKSFTSAHCLYVTLENFPQYPNELFLVTNATPIRVGSSSVPLAHEHLYKGASKWIHGDRMGCIHRVENIGRENSSGRLGRTSSRVSHLTFASANTTNLPPSFLT